MPEEGTKGVIAKSRTKDVVKSFQHQFKHARQNFVAETNERRLDRAFESAVVLQEKARDSLELLQMEEALRTKLLQKRAEFSLQLGRANMDRTKALQKDIAALEQELGKLLETKNRLLRFIHRKRGSEQLTSASSAATANGTLDEEFLEDETAALTNSIRDIEIRKEIFENELPQIFSWEHSEPPTPIEPERASEADAETSAGEYWESEHHRLDPQDLETGRLVSTINPFSYHNLHLSMYDTFVQPADFPRKVASRKVSRHQASTLNKSNLDSAQDMINMAFDHLSRRIHGFSNEICDTVDFQLQSTEEQKNVLRSRATRQVAISSVPTMSSERRPKEKPDSSRRSERGPESFTASFASRISSGTSIKTVARSTPKELFEVDYDTIFPKKPSDYAKESLRPVPVRLVNQKKLYEETRLENAVLKEIERERERKRKRTAKSSKSATSLPPISTAASGTVRRERKLTWRDKDGVPDEIGMLRLRDGGNDDVKGFTHGLSRESTIALTETWKQLKPSSDPIKHVGLKLERVKELLHYRLVSDRVDERVNAAKSLGLLGVADTDVIYGLRQCLENDQENCVRYECVKALVLLGVWEGNVLIVLTDFLRNVSNNQRVDLLETISNGRDIKFINQESEGFEQLKEVLLWFLTQTSEPAAQVASPTTISPESTFVEETLPSSFVTPLTTTRSAPPEGFNDAVALRAAVCLGRIGISNHNLTSYLLVASKDRTDFERKTDALYTLVYQLNYRENVPELVDEMLYLFRWSPAWRQRKLGANLLSKFDVSLLQENSTFDNLLDKIFNISLPRLWEDPIAEVRAEMAKTFVKVGLFERACVETVSKLDSPNEAERIISVTAVGSLGIKNPFVIRTLHEMLQFDTSDYVKLTVIKTFGAYSQPTAKIFEALSDASKADTLIGREAARVLRELTEAKARPKSNSTAVTLSAKPS